MIASSARCVFQEMDGMSQDGHYEENDESCRMMTKRRNPFGESTYRNLKTQVLDQQEVRNNQGEAM
jgi:hypothetical protein